MAVTFVKICEFLVKTQCGPGGCFEEVQISLAQTFFGFFGTHVAILYPVPPRLRYVVLYYVFRLKYAVVCCEPELY